MPSFTFQFGSVDLSAYVRVGPNEGLDPYDADGFEEPQFVDSPIGDGQALSNVDVQNRVQSWPLYLNADSKAELHALTQQINREIRFGARPLRVTWQDAGATDPSYYDVEHARLEPAFSLRHSEHGWLAGMLRVWSRGYAHTGTQRVIGTAADFRGIATLPIPSLGGDVSAQLELRLSGSYFNGAATSVGEALLTTVSVCNANAPAYLGASAIHPYQTAVSPTIAAASGAVGTMAIYRTDIAGAENTTILRVPFANASAYAGRNRVLLVGNNYAPSRVATAYIMSSDQYLTPGAVPLSAKFATVVTSPVTWAQAATGAWTVVDLGVLDIDPAIAGSQMFTAVISAASWGATTMRNIMGLMLLPEDRTVTLRDPLHRGHGYNSLSTYVFMGTDDTIVRNTTPTYLWFPMFERLNEDVTSKSAGRIPEITPGGSQHLFVAQLPLGATGVNNIQPNQQLGMDVRVRERFQFAR